MKVQTLWIVAGDTFEERITVLGGAKARLHLLACTITSSLTLQLAATFRLVSGSCIHPHAWLSRIPPQTAPLTASMHLLASSGLLKVMYALPVGPLRLAEDPYGPILFTDICFTIFPKAPKKSAPISVSS